MDFDLNWIWKSVLIVIAGTVLLRVAGRKSISQMTLAQTVIMIGIGSLLIQPLAGKNIWTTLFVGSLLVITLIIVEYTQLKLDFIEQLITGTSKILIEDGNLKLNNLRSVRLTVDQLETQLRLNSISKISDVKWATIEPNGQIGFILKDDAKSSTKKDIETLKEEIQQLKTLVNQVLPTQSYVQQQLSGSNQQTNVVEKLQRQITELNNQLKTTAKKSDIDLFKEIDLEKHNAPIPKHLQ
ncbi:DUF421 domain-containing protein [Alkalihalobacillus deserti]|uniref:DUF421 domain-containing protein n=1 Tax=Alkalihalobacillus deserti TaxID=2879466 RepID=UPI001D140338|nr:DUF421 domain-containing protein [Alkalihalobacillus deserti]